jgi:hypothetical protein
MPKSESARRRQERDGQTAENGGTTRKLPPANGVVQTGCDVPAKHAAHVPPVGASAVHAVWPFRSAPFGPFALRHLAPSLLTLFGPFALDAVWHLRRSELSPFGISAVWNSPQLAPAFSRPPFTP